MIPPCRRSCRRGRIRSSLQRVVHPFTFSRSRVTILAAFIAYGAV
ncbi:MAG TPA: hypothetical protein VGR37_21825 [Longimicrobiaceae bacterium]|nr:hypothetical protein [Longimicrobiaceae bacterium]